MTASPVRFACEPLTDALWDEALPLLVAHWREIAHYEDIPLDPDREVYRQSESAGILRVFTARRDGRLEGYAVFFVRANPHYRGSVQAVQDVLYLHPTVRGGTGYRFIAWCDRQLRAIGAQAVYHHVKAAHDFGVLLERQGYDLVDKIYAKRLDVPGRRSFIQAEFDALNAYMDASAVNHELIPGPYGCEHPDCRAVRGPRPTPAV